MVWRGGGQVSCYPCWFSTTTSSSTDRMLVPRNGTALTKYVQRVFPLSKKILDGHYIIGSPSQRFVVKYTVLTTFVSRCIASHMVLLCSGFHSQSSPSGIPLYGGQTLSPSEPEYITKNATMMMDHVVVVVVGGVGCVHTPFPEQWVLVLLVFEC